MNNGAHMETSPCSSLGIESSRAEPTRSCCACVEPPALVTLICHASRIDQSSRRTPGFSHQSIASRKSTPFLEAVPARSRTITHVLPPGLLVVHDTGRGGEDDLPERTSGEQLIDPVLNYGGNIHQLRYHDFAARTAL